HVEVCIVAAVGSDRVIVATEIRARVGIQLEIPPAALLLEGYEPLDGRARDDSQCNTLLDIACLSVPGTQQRRAHWARTGALRSEHVAVDQQSLLAAEQVGEADRPGLALEPVVLDDLATWRQGPALLGYAFKVTSQLDLFDQQGLASTP